MGQTFCYLYKRLHLFQLIYLVIKPPICNFLISYCVIYAYFELYPFLHKYVRLSPGEMHDFSLHDLHTIYLPPLVSILFINSLLPNLMISKFFKKYFDSSRPIGLTWITFGEIYATLFKFEDFFLDNVCKSHNIMEPFFLCYTLTTNQVFLVPPLVLVIIDEPSSLQDFLSC